ncbi:hypothetical protein ACF3M1_01840 [Luteimonas sp. WGS1318]|uniref:hypothetical protein n=1 Tax=Luteimonas sp. WGS1318 TaxID=3366815 RepID=UPI00372D51E9
MKTSALKGVVPAFLLAVVLAIVWGSIVQSQYNLAALASIGADIGSVRLQVTLRDIFSGFFPTYGGYVVAPAFLVAFGVVALLEPKVPGAARIPLYALAGVVALLIAIPLVNALSPVALLVGATREWSCTFWMAAAGLPAGLLYALLAPARRRTVEAPPILVHAPDSSTRGG